jgi:hypothetical protein
MSVYNVGIKVKEFRYRPGVAQMEVKVPRFLDNGTVWW